MVWNIYRTSTNVDEVFKQHNEQNGSSCQSEFSPTLERYETSYRHTLEYMKWKFQIEDIDIKKLNYEFIADYEFWLKSQRKCDHNTSVKYLSNFKKIVHICIKNGLTAIRFKGLKWQTEVERPFDKGRWRTQNELLQNNS